MNQGKSKVQTDSEGSEYNTGREQVSEMAKHKAHELNEVNTQQSATVPQSTKGEQQSGDIVSLSKKAKTVSRTPAMVHGEKRCSTMRQVREHPCNTQAQMTNNAQWRHKMQSHASGDLN
jgi:hypothetical protein